MNYAKAITQTPQSEPIPGKTQVENNAGGYVYQADPWQQLQRFLILGSEGGSYYVGQSKLTVENAQNVIDLIKKDGAKVVAALVKVSNEGLAVSNDPAIFALALVFANGNLAAKRLAADAVVKVCRIGTHLFTLVSYIDKLRSWGRLVRKAISSWYAQDYDKLAYQMLKYKNRQEWTHRDVIRQAHPKPRTDKHSKLFKWVKDGECDGGLGEFVEACHSVNTENAITLIKAHNLPREVLPTESLNDVKVWDALLQKMPLNALIRNLGKMSNVGLLVHSNFDAIELVENKLADAEYIRKSRLHPLAILNALYVYRSGQGVKGSLTWKPVQRIIDALDGAFYAAFQNVEPTGKNIFIALDVSGSMGSPNIAGTQLSPRDASAALALVTMRVESRCHVYGFTSADGRMFGRAACTRLDITPKMTLSQVINVISGLPFGGTDCALPMITANNEGLEIDAFFVYTDSETWAGDIHPSQALTNYRNRFANPNASLAVVGMVSNGFTIADPKDPRQMDIVGFSADTPRVLSQFAKGEV